jgi:hypothetical protein
MRIPGKWFLALGSLAALLGCGGGSSNSGGKNNLAIAAQYEKRTLSASGFGPVVVQPARYCYAEVRASSDNQVLSSGYLDATGRGTASIPSDVKSYLVIYASYQIPSTTGSGFFMRGSVVDPTDPNLSKPAVDYYDILDGWYVTSSDINAGSNSVSLTALINDPMGKRRAGAFSIADQAVTFGLGIQSLEPSLVMPNVHTFWTPSTNPADQLRSYPSPLFVGNTLQKTRSGRVILKNQVEGNASGAANTETDEWDEGALQEILSHALFADYSAGLVTSGGAPAPDPILRRDNDNVYVNRFLPSESTAAFVGGYCDFLGGALRNNNLLLDNYVNNSGTPLVDAFDLSSHSTVANANKGEFTRASIAATLWGIWKNRLGGAQVGLNTLWQAARSTAVVSGGVGEYNRATLACYPSYLLGVESRAVSQWAGIITELGLENISNPDPVTGYFNTNALWLTTSIPYSGSGSLVTYASPIYFDRNQSQAYRFTNAGGARSISVTTTSPRLLIELFDTFGFYSYVYATPSQAGVISANLPAGVYAVRVRLDPATNYVNGSASYNIAIN